MEDAEANAGVCHAEGGEGVREMCLGLLEKLLMSKIRSSKIMTILSC